MKALVNSPLCPLMLRPTRQCELSDEVLYGYSVEILEDTRIGWYQVNAPYHYIGYAPAASLLFGDGNLTRWEALPKRVVLKSVCDVLAAPRVESWCMQTLVRGALVAPVGSPNETGWQLVSLCDGREGYTKCSFLGEYYVKPAFMGEKELRAAIVHSAMRYLGVQYRWGGKSPLGIDCSGLTAMAYLLNGITIYRDAHIRDGFPLREIRREVMKPADLLFFPGHVALYLGDNRYIHSTAFPGSDGVVINSLDPREDDYRADLPTRITAIGSIF